MAEGRLGVPDEAAGAGVMEFRVRERMVGGVTVAEQYLLEQNERVASWKGCVSTPRMLPTATAALNFASLYNAVGSGVLVAVRRVTVQVDYTTNSATVRVPTINRVTAAPTGGAILTPVAFDTTQTQNANVVFRGAAASDGTFSAITATLVGGFAWRRPHMHFPGAAAAEQVRMDDITIVPEVSSKDPAYLREGEGFVVHLPDTASASEHLIINCMWEEFTLP